MVDIIRQLLNPRSYSYYQVFAKHVLRAMVAGTIATFMTACIAGMLYEDSDDVIIRNVLGNSTGPTFLVGGPTRRPFSL